MDAREQILGMAKMTPLLPSQVGKQLGKDMLIASAMLSELASKNLLKVSHLKIGSSPLYYDPGNKAMLQDFANHLNEKDKQTYDLLKEKKVLRESTLEPLTRVSIKNIKDFSRPLEVSFNNQKEIFWKWYLCSDDDVAPLIKKLLSVLPPKVAAEEPKEVVEKVDPEKPKTIPEKKVQKPKSKVKKLKKAVKKPVKEKVEDKKLKTFVDTTVSDPFLKKIHAFFNQNKITILEQEMIKKKSEFDFTIRFDSVMGDLVYFCKVKNKKRISDSDLSNTVVQAQLKKLPAIFMAPGELTKKAQEIQKELKGLTIKQL